MPTRPSTPPSATSSVDTPIPTWKACTDASSVAFATRARTGAGVLLGTTFASGWRSISFKAGARAGRDASGPRFESSSERNCAATTVPTAAMATSAATRAMALLTPEAIPAWRSSTAASTVAVTGVATSTIPKPSTVTAGRTALT